MRVLFASTLCWVTSWLFTLRWSTESRVISVPLLHQSSYASIHASIGSGKTLTLLRFWGAVVCATTTWCCRNAHILQIPLNLCICVKVCVGTEGERIKAIKRGEYEQLSMQRRVKEKRKLYFIIRKRGWDKLLLRRRGEESRGRIKKKKGRRRGRNVRGELEGS